MGVAAAKRKFVQAETDTMSNAFECAFCLFVYVSLERLVYYVYSCLFLVCVSVLVYTVCIYMNVCVWVGVFMSVSPSSYVFTRVSCVMCLYTYVRECLLLLLVSVLVC